MVVRSDFAWIAYVSQLGLIDKKSSYAYRFTSRKRLIGGPKEWLARKSTRHSPFEKFAMAGTINFAFRHNSGGHKSGPATPSLLLVSSWSKSNSGMHVE